MPSPRIVNGLDELRVLAGQEVGVSDWLLVTQRMIDQFAELTGDPQWIHIDVERAKTETPFSGTITHGFLTLSLLPKLARNSVDGHGDFKMHNNYGFNNLRFVSPLPAASRMHS